jgi:hypothetical protein
VRSGAGLWVVGGEGFSHRLLDRGGVHIEGVGDLGAVDDEGIGELVPHLEQLPHCAVGQRRKAKEEGRYLPDPARSRVASPIAPVPKMTWRAVRLMSCS